MTGRCVHGASVEMLVPGVPLCPSCRVELRRLPAVETPLYDETVAAGREAGS
jgi:hypothetical protein